MFDINEWSRFVGQISPVRKIAIEAKSSSKLSGRHFKGLKALQEENCFDSFILVCREKEKRLVDGIYVYPWELFLNDLWDGKILPKSLKR
jgi:hypothetical protein